MAIVSKYPGFCPNCNQRFIVGKDMIEKKDGKKWVHVICSTQNQSNLFEQNYQTKVGGRYKASINIPLPIEVDGDALAAAIDTMEPAVDLVYETKVSNFIPSKYQQDFFDTLMQVVSKSLGIRHIVVEAVAGSGKTTTLIEGIKRLREQYKDLSICIVAFNKHIATEFQNKLVKMIGPNHGVLASTKHSLGLRAIKQSFPKVQVDDDKVGSILDNIWPVSKQALKDGIINHAERKQNYIKRISMRKLVDICKSVLVDVLDTNAVVSVIDRYGVEVDADNTAEIIEKLPEVMELCKQKTDVVDFSDMGWLPIVLDLNVEKFDVLLIDEAQDMSNGDMEFLFRCVKETGNIIAVGDRNQSLYGFRGADTDAIPNIIKMLDAKVLPLSVTYRCPITHVIKAQELVPQLEARENAPQGLLADVDYFNLVSQVQPGDMVICRTNAPLIKPAFQCIRAGKKAIIRGKDIGASLTNLIKRFETNDLRSFEASLNEYFEHEYTKLMDKGREMQALQLQDKVETLRYIMNECSTVAELISKIDLMFSDNNIGVVFSSVHRAKGLEADNVFILRPDLMPHPKAKKDYEIQQEKNGLYVAETRSKANLYFVKGGENV